MLTGYKIDGFGDAEWETIVHMYRQQIILSIYVSKTWMLCVKCPVCCSQPHFATDVFISDT